MGSSKCCMWAAGIMAVVAVFGAAIFIGTGVWSLNEHSEWNDAHDTTCTIKTVERRGRCYDSCDWDDDDYHHRCDGDKYYYTVTAPQCSGTLSLTDVCRRTQRGSVNGRVRCWVKKGCRNEVRFQDPDLHQVAGWVLIGLGAASAVAAFVFCGVAFCMLQRSREAKEQVIVSTPHEQMYPQVQQSVHPQPLYQHAAYPAPVQGQPISCAPATPPPVPHHQA